MNAFGENISKEYREAILQLDEVIVELRKLRVPDDLLYRLDAAENRIAALEVNRMFFFAADFGARLQRKLV